jgi:hypothetical protein
MDFAESFLDPPAELRIRPLWHVDGALTPTHAEWLCGQLRDKGLGGAVLLPADGFAEVSAQIARAGEAMGLRMRDLGAEPGSPDHAALHEALGRFTWEETMPAHLKRVADLLALAERPAPLPWPLRSTVATGADQPYAASLFYQAPVWPVVRPLADYAARLNLLVRSASRAAGAPGLCMEAADPVHTAFWRRDGRAFALVVNTGNRPATVPLTLQAGHVAERWSLEDGTRQAAGLRPGVPAAIHLAPTASELFLVAPGEAHDPGSTAAPAAVQSLRLAPGGYHATPYGGNFLHFAPDWGEDDGVAAFHVARPLANLRILTDRRALANAGVHVDGQPLPPPDGWEMDLSITRHPLPVPLAPGPHTVRVHSDAVPGALLLARHCWLAGDFIVAGDPEAPELHPVPEFREGPWERQGLPGFSGTLACTTEFALPPGTAPRRVLLDAGTVSGTLEVEVNGKVAGRRLWPPHVVEITSLLRHDAPNLVVLKVTNGLANLLAEPGAPRASGLLSPVFVHLED